MILRIDAFPKTQHFLGVYDKSFRKYWQACNENRLYFQESLIEYNKYLLRDQIPS